MPLSLEIPREPNAAIIYHTIIYAILVWVASPPLTQIAPCENRLTIALGIE